MMTDTAPSTLSIPDITPDMSAMDAAFAYAAEGLYVLPIKRGSKHPGSVVGKGWHTQSTRDPEMIAALWAGEDHGIALHCGRSGIVTFDVDDPTKLPPPLIAAIIDHQPPHQSTREDVVGRGHHLFRMPPGRTIGNSVGRLGGGWGEVRGLNGIIVVAPSAHELAGGGGRYMWRSTGPIPTLPADLADALNDASPAQDSASDEVIGAFLAQHDQGEDLTLLDAYVHSFRRDVERGESRHQAITSRLAGAMKEARAGYYPADMAVAALENEFVTAVTRPGVGTGQTGGQRSEKAAHVEFASILAWAVGQALAADLTEVHGRVAQHRPIDLEEVITPTRKEQPWDTTTPKPSSSPSTESPQPSSGPTDSPTDAATTSPDTPSSTPPTPASAESAESASPEQIDPHDATRRLFPRIDWHKLWEAPDEEDWILEPILPVGRLVALYSAPKVGKSLLMLEIAAAVSMGRKFGISEPERRYRVLYVDFENDPKGDVRQRLRAMGHGPEDLDYLDYLSFPTMGALDSERGGLELLAAAEAYKSEVVIVDTISRAVQGEENDNDTWLNLYRKTGMRLKASGIAMLRLDHSGKDADKGMRGGSAKVGDVDAIWRLSTINEGKRYRLECTDARMLVEHRDLQLIRHPYPLRHEVDVLGINDGVEDKIATATGICDAAELPDDAGRRKISDVLTKAGFKLGNQGAAEVARRRKDRSVTRQSSGPRPLENDCSNGTGLTSSYTKAVLSNTGGPQGSGTTGDQNGITAGQTGPQGSGTTGDQHRRGARWSPPLSLSLEREGTAPDRDRRTVIRHVAGELVHIDVETGDVIEP